MVDRFPGRLMALLLLPATLAAACVQMPPCPPPPASTTVAVDPSAPKTREQVRAEVMAARQQGTLEDFNGLITVAREWPGSGGNAIPSCR
jgi:hypothetical protein